MFRIPRYSIFLFVGLSILTAFFIHQGMKPDAFGSTTFSSQSVENMMSSAINQAEKVGLGLPVEIAKCDCVLDPQKTSHSSFEYEDPASCNDNRKTFENALKNSREISPLYRDERAKRPVEFPKACMLFIMNEQMGDGKEDSSSLVRCENASSNVTRGNLKSCVTGTFVNTVYNYFGDVTDCMEIPQRPFLPKIFSESGFHPDVMGQNGEIGIGQLSDASIEHANQEFLKFKEQVLQSGRESCQRLASQIQQMRPISHQSSRCGLVAAPENPIRNLFYMGIVHHQNLAGIESAMEDFRIVPRMAALGLSSHQYDREQVIHILQTLGSETGARTAVILLSNYLKKIENSKKKLTVSDFDFSIGIEQKVFTDASGKKEKVSLRKLTLERKNPWNFPGYLAINQKYGTVGIVTVVRSYADDLNKVFKEGVCVPDSYLAL